MGFCKGKGREWSFLLWMYYIIPNIGYWGLIIYHMIIYVVLTNSHPKYLVVHWQGQRGQKKYEMETPRDTTYCIGEQGATSPHKTSHAWSSMCPFSSIQNIKNNV